MKQRISVVCFALILYLTAYSVNAQNTGMTITHLPGVVVGNHGQWNREILYGDMLGRYAFTKEGMLLVKSQSKMNLDQLQVTDHPSIKTNGLSQLKFLLPSPNMIVESIGESSGIGHLYKGSDSSKWVSGMSIQSGVIYRNVWDSVDAEFKEIDGNMALKLCLRPGASVHSIRIECDAELDPKQLSSASADDITSLSTSDQSNGKVLYWFKETLNSMISKSEYLIYIGGNYFDYLSSIHVADDGSIYVVGYTQSQDFLSSGNREGIFIMHSGCDGGSVIYNTVYSADTESVDIAQPIVTPACFRKNGNAIAAGHVDVNFLTHIPLTPDAMEFPRGKRGASVVFELDNSGRLLYATLFGQGDSSKTSGNAYISAMTLDSHDELFVMGTAKYGFPYITPGTVGSHYSSTSDYVVKFNAELDSVLWGTRVGGSPAGSLCEWNSLAVDSLDNVIVLGKIYGGDTIRLVNAAISELQYHGLYLQKLTPNADAFVFSTYIGGKYMGGSEGNEITVSGHPKIGRGNTIQFVGSTNSVDFPIVNSKRHYNGNGDGFFMVFSPDGRILKSFCFGGVKNDVFIDFDIDSQENLYVMGLSNSSDYPVTDTNVRIPDDGNKYLTLSVISAGTDSLLFSTYIEKQIWYESGYSCGGFDLVNVRPTGHVIFGGTTLINQCNSDVFIKRMFQPFAGQDFLKATVRTPDSMRLEVRRNVLYGNSFPVHVRVDNQTVSDTACNPAVTLTLPTSCKLDPQSQSLVRSLSTPFLPGAHEELEWTVRIDTVTALDSVFKIKALVEYDAKLSTCERLLSRSKCDVVVHRYESPEPVYTCIIEAPETLSVTADSLAGNPFPVRCHIRNTGQSTFTLSGLRLALPTGTPAALELVPVGDSLRPGGALAPGEEMVREWMVKALYFPNTSERVIKLVVIDTFGYRLPGCEKSIVIPGLKRTVCAITATDTVAYNTAQGMYLPSPLNVDLIVSSDLDTTLAGVTARLDLAHASHLRLVTGDSSNRSLPSISAHGSMGARWRLEVVPHPSGPVSDTLFVYHQAPGWTEELWCMHIMRIIPPVKDVSCSLGAPAVTVTATNTYSPDTAVVKWIVMNNGAIAVSGLTVHLDMSCDPAWCLDAPDRSVGIVQPSGRDSVTWRLVPKTSAFEREISLRVTARDSLGTEITSCDAVLQLPRIYPPLHCTLTCPDTLHYMSQTDSYNPDPFSATVTVENLVDTVMTASAQMDLSGASHLKLAPSETGQAALGIVQPHGTAQHSFSVAVSTPAGQTSSEDITVKAEGLFSGTQFESVCTTPTVMQPRPSIHTAECFTAGHDTVWADPVLEDLIPHPIQIRNGIINTGNDPLENCEAAIIVPDGYILTQPPDSIQKYAPIAPGDTGRREWLLEVNRNSPTPDPRTVRFVWHCDSGVQGECTRDVVLKASSPQGLVLSKWRLLFSAEMSSAIPASQKVSVWTGGNAPFAWQPVTDVSWLSATPSVLGGSGTIDIVPTTTAMSVGTYEGKVSIVTSEYARPEPIEVGYEIWIKSDAKPLPTPSGMWLECVPNPARPGGTLHIRYSVDKPGAVRIQLMDALGREVKSEYREAFSTDEQQTILCLPSSLVPGAYFIVLEQTARRAVKGVVVR